jgi:hypothetical protein
MCKTVRTMESGQSLAGNPEREGEEEGEGRVEEKRGGLGVGRRKKGKKPG